MKIYLLKRKPLKNEDEWDVYIGFVISANNIKQARQIASKESDEKLWNSNNRISCECIGESKVEEGIILYNYRD